MSRQLQRFCAWFLIGSLLLTGCHPVNTFYLHEDGDLSHYLDVGTDIEYADIHADSLDEVEHARAPRTILSQDFDSIWELSLEEAVAITLQNSKVLRIAGQTGST